MEREQRPVGEDLARIADELLEHTRALRRQHEELRDALAGVAPAPAPVSSNGDGGGGGEDRTPDLPDSLHAMALQMALAGESRESVKEQFHTLHVDEDRDAIVDEVFDRVERRRSEGRRRRFSRRSS